MKFVSICIAFAVIAGLCGFSAKAASEPSQAQIESANLLFQSGKFAEAGEIYARIVAQDPNDYSAIVQLGRVALLANRLDDAQMWLERANAVFTRREAAPALDRDSQQST